LVATPNGEKLVASTGLLPADHHATTHGKALANGKSVWLDAPYESYNGEANGVWYLCRTLLGSPTFIPQQGSGRVSIQVGPMMTFSYTFG
jgi:hypothetical protein